MLKSLINDLRSQDWVNILLKHGNLFAVGGCVRDALINKAFKDVDIVIEGPHIDDVKNLLKDYGKSKIVGQSFAVIKFKPRDHVGEDYDIAVPRTDRKIGTGHKGFEVYTKGVTIKEDLKRRDFTINSIAVNVKTGEVLDPFNGRKDLQARLLRATDSHAFSEDPLRLIRAIQFSARFKFDIEPGTLKLMKQNAHLIKEISGERILEEFNKILYKSGSTKVALDLIERSDIDKALFNKKFDRKGFEHFDGLDAISFYYVLGTLGYVKSPSEFYEKRLKGEAPMIKALQTLEKTYSEKLSDKQPEQQLKWNIFLMLKSSPMLKDAEILPGHVSDIIDEMKAGKIPMKFGDIPVNGNEIMDKFNIKEDKEVGNIINKMYQDALMNKFDWKNKEKTLKYLETL